MSASSFPSEIWRSVFRHATYVPLLLDTGWEYGPDERMWEGWVSVKDDEVATRRMIVNVCRSWRDLGAEFLYEVVQIQRDDQDGVERLVGIFEDSCVTKSGVGYGWWTKRIDCPASLLTADNVEYLINLLEVCHNLQIFVVGRKGYLAEILVYSRIASILQSRFLHSLRRVDLPWRMFREATPINYISVLPDVPLTSLAIMLRGQQPDEPTPISFFSITTLTISLSPSVGRPPSHLLFPALHALSLLFLGTNDIPMLRPFIRRHDRTLRHIHIDTTHAIIHNIPDLVSCAKNIATFSMNKRDLESFGQSSLNGMDPLTGITHLGVTWFHDGLGLESFWNGMHPLLRRRFLPDLRVVRLMDVVSPISTEIKEWRGAIFIFRAHKVQLQDMFGNLIAVTAEPSLDDI